MTKGIFLLFLISSLVYWIFGWFLIPKLRYLRALKAGEPREEKKKVSIIIPARNEADRLGALLESLKREGAFERHEVLLADDGSADATAEVASAYGCNVITITDKPEEAQGKSWACAAGAEVAGGDCLVFLDADVVFLPGGLDAVLNSFSGGLLSVQPFHRFRKFYESFSAFFNLLAVAGVNSFSLHSSETSSLGAFGPCMVCGREDYRAAGGHLAILDDLVDDLALARLFKKHGLPVRNYAGKGWVEYRMYPEGPGALWSGWIKNMASASSVSSRLTGLYFGIWCAGVANLALSFATARLFDGPALIFSALAYLIYALQFRLTQGKLGNWGAFHALFFPLYLVFFLIVLASSGIQTKLLGYANWKGRRITIKKT